MENNNINKVYIAAISYALITGLSFLFSKIALSATVPLDLLAHRFTASFLGIMIPVLLKWVKLDYNRSIKDECVFQFRNCNFYNSRSCFPKGRNILLSYYRIHSHNRWRYRS